MKVELTIQGLYECCPDLFQTRQQCLNHLFCTIGNGFRLENGQLVTCYDRFVKRKSEYNPETGLFTVSDLRVYTEEELDKRLVKGKAFQHDKNPESGFMQTFLWYPISKESYLYLDPGKLEKDWADALLETKNLIKKDGILF